MADRLRVYLVFGGRSGEHEVSLMSARSVMSALDPERYEVVPIGITKEGRWLLTGDPMKALTDGVAAAGGAWVGLVGDPTQASLVPMAPDPAAGSSAPAALQAVSGAGDRPAAVFFPVLHGTYGEDGTIQGLLELAGVPYVGCGVLGSAVGMDKAVAKSVFRAAGIPIPDYRVVLRERWEREPEAVLAGLAAVFRYPCFVKPCNLGSSLGISKAKDRDGLRAALDLAARFDRRLLIEEGIDAREIEVSVLGNDQPVASVPGEIIPGHEFYDYDDKYFDDKSRWEIPAAIPPEAAAEVQRYAVEAFTAIDGAGMARVDFFYERGSGRVLLNEVNTIPGFTRISMYPKLWEASGLPYPRLVDRLIELAVQRWADRQRNETSL